MNSTLVGYFISLYLQKTNASSGRTSLAFLDEEDGDDVINYRNIFGSKGEYEQTFKKHLFSFFLAQKIENYTKSEDMQQQFPFHAYSTNLLLSLMGYWIYLNEKPLEKSNNYLEDKVRDFLNSQSFAVSEYLTLDKSIKEISLNYSGHIDKVLEFYTEKIHDKLNFLNIGNQPRKIYNLFKGEGTVKDFSDYLRPNMVTKKLLLKRD